jgi:hypothetical protein
MDAVCRFVSVFFFIDSCNFHKHQAAVGQETKEVQKSIKKINEALNTSG